MARVLAKPKNLLTTDDLHTVLHARFPRPTSTHATLIVCPVSVLSNWTTQMEMHAGGGPGGLAYCVYHGAQQERLGLDHDRLARYVRQHRPCACTTETWIDFMIHVCV